MFCFIYYLFLNICSLQCVLNAGQVSKFFVNTVNAGAGALAVTVEGPSKVRLECKESNEGYEFTYTPTAPGDYLVTIKYAGVHIAGSPFKAKVEGKQTFHILILFLIIYLCVFGGRGVFFFYVWIN